MLQVFLAAAPEPVNELSDFVSIAPRLHGPRHTQHGAFSGARWELGRGQIRTPTVLKDHDGHVVFNAVNDRPHPAPCAPRAVSRRHRPSPRHERRSGTLL